MKFPCTLKNALLIIRDRFGCPLPQKDWATFLHTYCYYRYLLVTNYLAIKLLTTYNYSTYRQYLTENYLSLPSAPRWVQQSYLSKRSTIDPLYLWVIKAIFWRRCWGGARGVGGDDPQI